MTPAQEKALLANVLELRSTVRRLEASLETVLAQGRERIELMRQQRQQLDTILRLIREKQVLLEAVGRMALNYRDRDTRMEIVGPDLGDIERIAREIREAH
jgi:hypothetical protein